jgi:hypothetical protein
VVARAGQEATVVGLRGCRGERGRGRFVGELGQN